MQAHIDVMHQSDTHCTARAYHALPRRIQRAESRNTDLHANQCLSAVGGYTPLNECLAHRCVAEGQRCDPSLHSMHGKLDLELQRERQCKKGTQTNKTKTLHTNHQISHKINADTHTCNRHWQTTHTQPHATETRLATHTRKLLVDTSSKEPFASA